MYIQKCTYIHAMIMFLVADLISDTKSRKRNMLYVFCVFALTFCLLDILENPLSLRLEGNGVVVSKPPPAVVVPVSPIVVVVVMTTPVVADTVVSVTTVEVVRAGVGIVVITGAIVVADPVPVSRSKTYLV